MVGKIIILVMTLFLGIYFIVATIKDLDFFFEGKKAQRMVARFGRKFTRIFYGILGVVVIITGLFVVVTP